VPDLLKDIFGVELIKADATNGLPEKLGVKLHYGHNSEKITEILERGAIPKYNEAKYNEGKPEKALRVNDVIKYATTDKDFTKVKGSLEECWRIAQDNGTVKLYVERPKVLNEPPKWQAFQAGQVKTVQFSNDETIFASGGSHGPGGHGRVVLWSSELGVRLRVFPTNNRVVGLAFAPDGLSLAVGENHHVTLLNLETGGVERQWKAAPPVNATAPIAFSPFHSLVLAGTDTGIGVLDIEASDREHVFVDGGDDQLYVSDLNGDVTEKMMYDLFEGVRPSDHPTVASIRVCHDSVPRPIAYAYVNYHKADDAKEALRKLDRAAIAGRPCRLMWSKTKTSFEVTCVSISAEGDICAVGHSSGVINLWNVASVPARVQGWSSGHRRAPPSAVLVRTDPVLVQSFATSMSSSQATSPPKQFRSGLAAELAASGKLKDAPENIREQAAEGFKRDTFVAVVYNEADSGTLRLLDAATGRQVADIESSSNEGKLLCLAANSSGSVLACGTEAGVLLAYPTGTAFTAPVALSESLREPVECVAFCADPGRTCSLSTTSSLGPAALP
jgi:WD40 repeat protein